MHLPCDCGGLSPTSRRWIREASAVQSLIPWMVRRGEVGDLSQFLTDPKVEGTVFEVLRETFDFFARVDVQMGAVHWPNGA